MRRHQEHDGNQGEKGNGSGDQLNDCLPAIGVPVEIAMGGQSFCLQAQLRRKLRLVLNVQVVPQYGFMIPESASTWFEGIRQ
jgi:hypothetical protein